MKVYVIQYVLFKITNGTQEMIDTRITGVYSKFDGEGSAVEALRNIAHTYGKHVTTCDDEIAIFNESACYNVEFDKDGNVLDSYFDKKVYEKNDMQKTLVYGPPLT